MDVPFSIASLNFTIAFPSGHTLAGWYTNSNFHTPYTGQPVFQDVNLFARLDVVTFNITYILNGGHPLSGAPSSFTVLNHVSLPVPLRARYDFKGWYRSPNFIGVSVFALAVGTTSNQRLYARWEAITFTVQFIVQGEVWRTEIVPYGTSLVEVQSIHFQEWFKDEDLTLIADLANIVVTSDMELYGENTPPVPIWLVAVAVVVGIIVLTILVNFLNMIIAGSRRRKRRR